MSLINQFITLTQHDHSKIVLNASFIESISNSTSDSRWRAEIRMKSGELYLIQEDRHQILKELKEQLE